jgi:chemotaxis protein methyltransferase CheR
VRDADCIAFLQWALPRLDLRWPGYRKVRRQVCRRLIRRIRDLQLPDLPAYRNRLEADPAEWRALDECCHITISRFYRDRQLFGALRTRVLPESAARAQRQGRNARVWSAGCASGEEPYTVKIAWDVEIADHAPGVDIALTATDIDATMLARATKACFAATSLRELPRLFIDEGFDRSGECFCVKPKFRQGINFLLEDLRLQTPPGPFDLVLCRYVAFTYFAQPLQERILERILAQLLPSGYLVIGTHEQLPCYEPGLTPLAGAPQIFQKVADLR